MDWTVILGPAGVAVVAILAVVALWRQHMKDDEQKDDALKLLTTAVPDIATALRDLTTVVKDSTKGINGTSRTRR